MIHRDGPQTIRIPPWLLLAMATLFGVFAAQEHVESMGMRDGHGVPFAHGLAMRMPFWYVWALLVPLLQVVAHRFPLERMRLVSGAAIHLSLAVVISVLHHGLEIGIQLLLPRWVFQMGHPFPGSLEGLVRGALGQNLPFYVVLLTGVYCLEYYARFRERELAATQLQGQLAAAQLQALRMQLDPHFLFNAMNSISMLVRGGRNDEAVRMLAGLAELLRSVLDEERPHEVPLREELAFLRRYLAIERIRAGRLDVREEVEPEALEARVPNLILQPIVENAIRHGIARRSAASLLEIGARREDGTLVLSVRDDGPGLGEGETEGVGLRNTRARLARLYGDEQRLALENAAEGGARVTLRMPFVRDDAEVAAR